MEKLTLINNPYLVKPSKKAQDALKLAISNNLFDQFKNLDRNLINDYLNSKINIPIWIIEAACKINEQFLEIPIQFQNIWFCLNGVNVMRIKPSGKIVNTKILFAPVYVRTNEKIKLFLDKITSLIKKNKLINLS